MAGEPPLVVYVTLHGPVPVRLPVSTAPPEPHSGPLPLSVAVGRGLTTMFTEAGKTAAAQLASEMAVMAYVVVAVIGPVGLTVNGDEAIPDTVAGEPPLVVYVMLHGPVPV